MAEGIYTKTKPLHSAPPPFPQPPPPLPLYTHTCPPTFKIGEEDSLAWGVWHFYNITFPYAY